MELLTTFGAGEVKVQLIPNHQRPGGVFTVRVDGHVVFDRKAQVQAVKRFMHCRELGECDQTLNVPAPPQKPNQIFPPRQGVGLRLQVAGYHTYLIPRSPA